MTSKMASSRSLQEQVWLSYGDYPIGCEEMATRRKKLSFRMVYNSIGN